MSISDSNTNAKRLLRTITSPDRLSQFRKIPKRGKRGVPVSVLMVQMTLVAPESPGCEEHLSLRGGGGKITNAAARGKVSIREMRVYFLNVRMCATSPLMSASDAPSIGFITTLPSLSLSPSLMALNAASSFNSAWTLASV